MPPGRKVVLAILGSLPLCAFLLFLLYGPSSDSPGSPAQPHVVRNFPGRQESLEVKNDYESGDFWKTVDLQKHAVPEDVVSKAKNVDVFENKVTVEGATVFYREAKPFGEVNPHVDVLLMHGAAFSSKTWHDLGTIQILAAMGYRTVAIDIPGFGNSPSASISSRENFVNHLAEKLQLRKPVIVSPSMSGTYSLPYMMKYWSSMGGYVPVAPVGIDVLGKFQCKKSEGQQEEALSKVSEHLRGFLEVPVPDLSCLKVPTLVVYGELDRSRSSAMLSLLPWSQEAEIPKGKHPAYLDNPELWHKLLYNFLSRASARQNSQKN